MGELISVVLLMLLGMHFLKALLAVLVIWFLDLLS